MKKHHKLFTSILLVLSFSSTAYAQVCNDRIKLTTPDSRFEVLGGEVIDLKTGLIWQRCSVGQIWDGTSCTGSAKTYDWSEALMLTSGEWRLPNIKELASIVETACKDPSINLSIFPSTESDGYRSASPLAEANGGFAWYVKFNDGDGNTSNKTWGFYVRLVRGG